MKMSKPTKCLTGLVACVVVIGITVLILGLLKEEHVDDAEKEKIFKGLLNDWQLNLQTVYKVTHYKEQATRSEWATVLMRFRLELPKEQAVSLLSDPQLKKMLWSRQPSLLSRSPKVDWWEAETGATCFDGFLKSKDKRQFIKFYLTFGTNSARIFVESLTRKGEKKECD